MGFLFRPARTYTLPPGAEIVERGGKRIARWRDRRGRLKTAGVVAGRDGADRISVPAAFYSARYRDASGVLQTVATGCREESAARRVLSDLESRAERVRSGLLSADEEAALDHRDRPFLDHADDFLGHLRARGTTEQHRRNVSGQLQRLARECGLRVLSDLTRTAIERWMVAREAEGMGARTRNAYLAAALGLCNWCVRERRLATSPLTGITKADARSDPRRQRRALTEDEIVRLLEVAQRRPLEDALLIRRGTRKGQLAARVGDAERERLEALGRERALIYRTLVLTGLRKGELASLTVGSLELDPPTPFARLEARNEKARRGADIPLRADLATDIRSWLADRLAARQREARAAGEPVPMRLDPGEPLFTVPDQLFRILDRDLVAAGIARMVVRGGKRVIDKRDDRGRSIDVHALRHTFGTLLCRSGVPLRTAQAAMRHSDPSLTAVVYVDPRLLDVAGALDALPALRLADRGPARASAQPAGASPAR